MLTANITLVQLGYLTIEGLLCSEGNFYVGIPQMVESGLVKSDRHRNELRTLKLFLPEGFQFVKIKTKLNPKAINTLSLLDFEKLLAKLDRAGNKKAQELRDDLVGLSLTQLFSDAFNIKFEKEERKDYLEARQEHRDGWRKLYTSWQKLDGCVEDYQYGRRVNQLKSVAGLPIKCIDTYDSIEVRKLVNAEIIYDAMRRSGKSHNQALCFI